MRLTLLATLLAPLVKKSGVSELASQRGTTKCIACVMCYTSADPRDLGTPSLHVSPVDHLRYSNL